MSGGKPTIHPMRIREPAHRVSAAAGLAAGGVLAGHSLAYAIIAPDAAVRGRLLASTGHGYLPAANVLTLLAVLATLGALFLGRLTRPWATPGWKALSTRVAALQIGAFLAMEVFERLSSGTPLSGLLHGGLLPVGIVVQLPVAGIVAALVRLTLRASDAVAAVMGRAPRLPSGRASVLPHFTLRAPSQPEILLSFGRGPPTSR